MSPSPWYAQAFDASYLTRYAHRSDADAAQEVQFLIKRLNLPRGARLLDYCCGAGRHSRAFAQAGFTVHGFDLSANLLARAASVGGAVKLARADMRRPPYRSGAFDAVVSLFTSFGYFETDDENAVALREAVRVLKSGGVLALDFFNAQQLRGCLVPRSEKKLDAQTIVECRRYDEKRKRIEKEITTLDAGGKQIGSYSESVRAFTREELTLLIESSGMKILEVFGDLQGSPYDAGTSPRCVHLARKG